MFFVLLFLFLFRVFFFRLYNFLFIYVVFYFFFLILFVIILCLYLIEKNLVSNFIFFIVFTQSNIFELFFFKFIGLWSTSSGSIFLIFFFLSFILLFFLFFYRAYFYFYLYFITSFYFFLLFFWGLYLFLITNPTLSFIVFKFFSLQLNPLLQDFILAVHPPILYFGYILYLVLLSFFFFLLKFSLIHYNFLRWGNTLVFFSFIFLTFGIFLGSWWAYFELGWGGWWFWDPVENISLLPWLLTLLYIHFINISLRNTLLSLFLLFIGSFLGILILLSFFFLRSGLLFSVHNFINDVNASFILLGFCLFVIFRVLYLFFQTLFSITASFFFKLNLVFFSVVFLLFCCFVFLLTGTFFYSVIIYFFQKVSIFTITFFNEIFSLFALSLFFILFKYIFSYFTVLNYVIFFIFYFLFFIIFFENTISLGFWLFTFFIIYFIFCLCILSIFRLKTWFFSLVHIVFFIFIYFIFCYVFYSFDIFSIFNAGDYMFFFRNIIFFKGLLFFNSDNYFSLWGNFFLLDWTFSRILATFSPHSYYFFVEKIMTFKVSILTNFLADICLYLGEGSLITGWYVHLFYNFGMPLIWLSFILFVLLLCFYLFFMFFFIKKLDIFYFFYEYK